MEDVPDADHREGFAPSAVPDPFQNVFEIRRELVSFFQHYDNPVRLDGINLDLGHFPGILFLEFFHAQVIPFAVVEKSNRLHGVAVHRDMVEGTIPFRRACTLFVTDCFHAPADLLLLAALFHEVVPGEKRKP